MMLLCIAFSFLSAVIVCIVILVIPIIYPTVVPYPWTKGSHGQQQKDKKRTAVLAGSFNPPHKGHLSMLLYLSERYGKVLVVIGMNPTKKYSVSPKQRAALIRNMLLHKSAKNVSVEVVTGYIWRTVKPQGAHLFVRGIRSWERDGKEESVLQMQNTWGPLVLGPLWWPLPTLFLEGKPEFNHVSSTLIRDLCRTHDRKDDLLSLVPSSIAQDIQALYTV